MGHIFFLGGLGLGGKELVVSWRTDLLLYFIFCCLGNKERQGKEEKRADDMIGEWTGQTEE